MAVTNGKLSTNPATAQHVPPRITSLSAPGRELELERIDGSSRVVLPCRPPPGRHVRGVRGVPTVASWPIRHVTTQRAMDEWLRNCFTPLREVRIFAGRIGMVKTAHPKRGAGWTGMDGNPATPPGVLHAGV